MHTVTELIVIILAGNPLTQAQRREIARLLLRGARRELQDNPDGENAHDGVEWLPHGYPDADRNENGTPRRVP